MTKTTRGIGAPVILQRVRLQRCKTTDCENRTRMALVVPLSDIGEDGGPGLGAIVQCGACLEQALINLTDAERSK